MSDVQLGQWWETSRKIRFCVVGQATDGNWILEFKSGVVTRDNRNWEGCRRLYNCDGWHWVETDQPDPGEGYELLEKGTRLRKGDQCLCDDGETWRDSWRWRFDESAGGPNTECQYRRKIPVAPPTVELCAMCGEVPEMPGIGACIECVEWAIEATGCPTVKPSVKRVPLRLWMRYEGSRGYVFAQSEPPVGANSKYYEVFSDADGFYSDQQCEPVFRGMESTE